MPIESNSVLLRAMGAIFNEGVAAELTDRQLLERFVRHLNGVAEPAFAVLVARHGPMVLRVCRAVLRNEHDAQDAFQAVFLVLVHKAGSLWARDSLGPWLHAVALRVSACARDSALRRRAHENQRAKLASRSVSDDSEVDDELASAIHEEVARLPDRYRAALVLCDLEGLTHEEAAWRLAWPVGTVKSRQARGRKRLRGRLIRRGLAPLAGTVIAAASAEQPGAVLPACLADSTVKIASRAAQGHAPAGVISAATSGLTQEVLRAMFVKRLQSVASVLFLLGTVVAGVGWTVYAAAAPGQLAKTGRAMQMAPTPLDALTAADIPAEKWGIEPPGDVVAVLGDPRGRHAGAVQGVAVSSDGKLIATIADDDKKVRLWDAETLRPLAALSGNRAHVNCMAISANGRWLAAGSGYGDCLLWDMSVKATKAPTPLVIHGHLGRSNNTTHAVAFSNNGRTLAVAGDGKGVSLCELTGGQPVARGVLPDLTEEVRFLAFSPDGMTLALAGLQDGSVRLWDMTGPAPRARASLGTSRQRIGEPNLNGTISAKFAPDGKTLAALHEDGSIRLWDVSASDPVDRGLLNISGKGLLPAMLSSHATVAFAPDGKVLAAAQPDGSIWLRNLTGNGPAERAVFPAHPAGVTVLAFSPDGKTLFSGGRDHLIRAWDMGTRIPREKVKRTWPSGGLKAVTFSPDGHWLAVGGDDALVGLWNLSDTHEITKLPAPKVALAAGPVQSLAFSPDGKTLVCGNSGWDITRDVPAVRFVLPTRDIWSLSLSRDGKVMATGGTDHKVRLWDLTDAEPKECFKVDGDDQWPPVVVISPGSDHLVFSGPEHSVRLWDLTDAGPRERAQLKGTGWPISSLVFSPNGKLLTAGTNGGTKLWNVSGEKPEALHPIKWLSDLAQGCLGFSIAFSPDGTTLIAADEVSKGGWQPSRPAVCAYHVASGRRLHEWDLSAPCWAIAVAPDGRHVAAAQRDGITVILRLRAAPSR